MNDITDLQAGIAGEHLVCADLLSKGFRAFKTEQICPYDIAAEINGKLVKIQVKTTRETRAVPQRKGHLSAYMWHVRRAGKGGKRVYAENEFDLLALVALDIKKIAYLPPSKHRQTIHIRSHEDAGGRSLNGSGKHGKTFSMYTVEEAIREVLSG